MTAAGLGAGPVLGHVSRVDPGGVEIEVRDPALAARVTVSDLVALPTEPITAPSDPAPAAATASATSAAPSEFLIALVDSVDHRGAAPDGDGNAAGGGAPYVLRILPVGMFRSGEGSTGQFRRGATAYPHIGGRCHLIKGHALEAFMSAVAAAVSAEERLVLGRYVAEGEAPAVVDGNALFQRHVALLGSSGAGKSWAVATMLERAARLRHANLIVFDLHGEYGPLSDPPGGGEPIARGLRIAGPGDLHNADHDVLFVPYWLLERDELLALVLNSSDPHALDQVVRLTQHVQTLKGVYLVQVGREDTVTTYTVDSPLPYSLGHLVQMLRRDDTEQVPQPPSHRLEPGPHYGHLTGLISRFEARAADPRYGFIFNPPEHTLSYGWLADTVTTLLRAGPGPVGIKVIDLSEVPSSIVPLVVGALARIVYDVQFWMDAAGRTPVCLVCDEAHLYLPTGEERGTVYGQALQAFEAIAKEGRKYGVGLLVVSQRPTDVNRTILSQCNNFIAMRLTNDADQATIRRLVPETLAGVTDSLPVLDVGEALVIGDALPLPSRLKLDPPTIRPASQTQPYWSLWAQRPSSPEAIAAGVEAMRNQMRAARPA